MATTAGATTEFTTLLTGAGCTVANLGSDDEADKLAALNGFAAACCGMKYNNGTLTLTNTNAKEMLAYLDAGINEISHRVTKIGAAQNRVASAISALDVQSQNITSSLSTLRDTDIAEESSNYIQSQILQQAAATLLSTANQLPSIALNLI